MISNVNDIPIAMAVWAVHDDYDYQNMENYISVTGLLKPTKMIILSARNKVKHDTDVSDFVSRALGSSIHASVEKAWENYQVNLKKLGYPQAVIDNVIINPTPDQFFEGCIPIYIEQRACKKIAGYNVGGKFDIVIDGVVQDAKTTTAYTWLFGGRDEEHVLQGSIYRWLNPDKITEDYMQINYLFTDWQAFMARQKPTYPQNRLEHKKLNLMSYEDTEQWVENKIMTLRRLWNSPENLIPDCTPEELWQSEPVWKYYADASKTDGKSTKNFDDGAEAFAHLASKGNVGVVKEIPGEVKRCGYCNAYEVCEQRKRYFPDISTKPE